MAFNSLFFIFVFLPVSLALYQFAPGQTFKNVLLVLMGYLFYAWANPFNLLLIVLMTCLNFVIVNDWENKSDRKVTVSFVLTMILNIFILGMYRYTNQFIGLINMYFDLSLDTVGLAIPFGLSFFTLSNISYMADVYRGKCYVQENLIHYALYVSFFGKIGSGPVVQYADMEESLADHPITSELFAKGSAKFIRGLVKKVLLADQLGLFVKALTGNTTILGAWLMAIGFMLQLYFDFSGYSDMAIGLGNMFGFDWKENFDHPYTATSIREFWRKWHISLYEFFKDYIYIPLGGSKIKATLYIQVVLLIWVLSGIWHGANLTFLIWGVYFGIILILERYFIHKILDKNKKFAHVYTLVLVLFGWVMFMSKDVNTALDTFSHMFGMGSGIANLSCLFALRSYLIIILLSILFCTNFYEKLQTLIIKRYKNKSLIINLSIYLLLFIVCVACMVGSTYNPFLYFAF